MKYGYDIRFYLADEDRREKINLKEYAQTIEKAKDYFNEVGARARNVKRIEEMQIGDKELRIILESNLPLNTPTLALRSFSKFLIKTEFGEVAVAGNALFRGIFREVEVERDDISSSEMVKLLVEMLMNGKKADDDRINQIRNILKEWREER